MAEQHSMRQPIQHPMKHMNSVDVVLREDILAKTKELAELIATSDEVQTYREAERKIQENERVQSIIRAIKKKQKEIVGFQYFQNEQMVQKIEAEIRELQDELDGIPIVQQFQQTQMDINYMLQLIVNVIKQGLSEKISLDSGQ
jgi:cell fate (sporulation/competence/biofilm development) regulator YmcA (YheA/YmcA/DUF963 family)